MKTVVSVITWVNRVIMVFFTLFLLTGIVLEDFLFYAAYIAVIAGLSQLFSFVILLFYFSKITTQHKKLLLIYASSTLVYFLSLFIFLESFNNITEIDFVRILIWLMPVLLSFFWTYILESIHKEL